MCWNYFLTDRVTNPVRHWTKWELGPFSELGFEKMRRTIASVVVALLFCSCGISYSVSSATVHVELLEAKDADTVKLLIHDYLIGNDFRDMGHDEEMIDFLERVISRTDASAEEWQYSRIDLLRLTRSYENDNENLKVDVIDFSDVETKKRHGRRIDGEAKSNDVPILKLKILNYRPGGFSPEAHRFFQDFTVFLSQNYAGEILTIREPPPTDAFEYYKTMAINGATWVGWWLLIFVGSIAVIGVLMVKVLGRLGFGVAAKRIALILIGPILTTPLPFPAATIFVILLPSVFAIPAIGTDYFARIADFAVPSAAASLLLSIVFAFWFIRGSKRSNKVGK